jgi:GAF domain-containing protein
LGCSRSRRLCTVCVVTVLPASALTALLSLRFGEGDLSTVLDRIVTIGRDALDGADEVSITLVRDDRPWTAAYTGQLALDADELQYDRGFGPCIDAGVSGTLLRVEDMREETRWPDYAAVVVPRGVLSSLSVPLPLQTELVGAMNCYARVPGAFSESPDAALQLASHVAVALSNAISFVDATELAANMRAAMESRSVIEQAKGIIMAQNRCPADQAFEVLRRASQGRNVKLRDLAHDLVARVAEPPASTTR